MNSPIIIRIIASFLEAETLIKFSQVCKLFNKISKTDELWEHLYKCRYISTLEIFGEILTGKDSFKALKSTRSFLNLFKQAVIKENQWKTLSGKFFFDWEIKTLRIFIAENLKDPMLSLPTLRREGKNFSTTIQDLLGNAFSEPPMLDSGFHSEAETIAAKLFEFEPDLYSEYLKHIHEEAFIKHRWVLNKFKPQANHSPLGMIKNAKECPNSLLLRRKHEPAESPYFLCQFVKVVGGMLKVHCQSVISQLEKATGIKEIISEYCLRWDGYSAAIATIDTALSPLNILFNGVYDKNYQHGFRTPAFSVLRLGVIIWRRVVFEAISERLITCIVHILQSVRETLKKYELTDTETLEIDINLLAKSVQSFVDLSGNELTFQYIDHTKFKAGEAYIKLEQKLERVSEQYYADLSNLQFKSLKILLHHDRTLISRIFIARTCQIIDKMILESLLQSFQSYYFGLYKDFPAYHTEETQADPLLYTAFGKMLFSNDSTLTSTKKIKNFIEYIKLKNLSSDIKEYNDIDFKLELLKKNVCEKDEEIEYVNTNAGFKLEIIPEESLFFRTDADILREDYDKIVNKRDY